MEACNKNFKLCGRFQSSPMTKTVSDAGGLIAADDARPGKKGRPNGDGYGEGDEMG